MGPFLETITSFPTVPLTVMLGVVVGYWIFALISGATFDGADAATGGVKAAADATVGAVKGAADAAVGAIKGAGEAAGHGDSHDLHDGGVLSLLGLAKVPITITLSTTLLVAWTSCVLGMLTLAPASAVVQSVLLVGALLAGLVGAAVLLRPLGKALDQSKPARSRDSLGQICTITSGRVDAGFGTAHVDDGGAGLNVHVVCEKANTLKKGDKAILVHFDAQKNVYEVEPVDWLEPQEIEALNDPTRAAQIISSRIRRN